MLTLAVLDPQELVAACLGAALTSDAGVAVAGWAAAPADAVRLIGEHQPDVVIAAWDSVRLWPDLRAALVDTPGLRGAVVLTDLRRGDGPAAGPPGGFAITLDKSATLEALLAAVRSAGSGPVASGAARAAALQAMVPDE